MSGIWNRAGGVLRDVADAPALRTLRTGIVAGMSYLSRLRKAYTEWTVRHRGLKYVNWSVIVSAVMAIVMTTAWYEYRRQTPPELIEACSHFEEFAGQPGWDEKYRWPCRVIAASMPGVAAVSAAAGLLLFGFMFFFAWYLVRIHGIARAGARGKEWGDILPPVGILVALAFREFSLTDPITGDLIVVGSFAGFFIFPALMAWQRVLRIKKQAGESSSASPP